jgi:hypothetical protein
MEQAIGLSNGLVQKIRALKALQLIRICAADELKRCDDVSEQRAQIMERKGGEVFVQQEKMISAQDALWAHIGCQHIEFRVEISQP